MKKIKLVLIAAALTLLAVSFAAADDREESKKLYDEAKTFADGGDFEAAIPLLEKSYELDARNFKAQKLLAECLDKKGKSLIEAGSFDQALDVYRRAYKLWPNNTDIKSSYDGLRAGSIQAEQAKAPEGKATPVAARPTPEPNTVITKQLDEAEKALTEISKSEAAKAESGGSSNKQALQEELDRQRALIVAMKKQYEDAQTGTNAPENASKDSQQIADLLFMYQKMIEEKKSAETPSDMVQLVEVMKQYRLDMQTQSVSPLGIALIAGGSSLGLIVIVLIFFMMFMRSQARKRSRSRAQAYTDAQRGYGGGLGSPQYRDFGPERKDEPTFLIGYDGAAQTETDIVPPAEEVSDEMYKDLLKYEKLKKMHTQMKSGNLNWDTVRENIDILHKDLQTEILKITEMKIMGGDITDISSIMPVLFPFITSGDDYLRKKANVLAYKVIESEKEKSQAGGEAADMRGGETPAEITGFDNLPLLTRYAEDVDRKLGKKGHSTGVANYAKRIGLMVGLDKTSIELLYKAGLVHDFGYFLFDDASVEELRKASSLSHTVLSENARHPEKGIEFFAAKNIVLPAEIEAAILHHHERNDGSGYARGLRDADIPVFGKIIAVADVFEALISDRPYREKMSFSSATIVMKDLARTRLNAEYVNAIIEFYKKV